MTGSAVQWVGEFLGLANPVADTVALANSVPDSDGVVFVPSMAGLGAPYWDANARGTISNLGRSHTAAHLARAAIDAIAFQVADVFLAMEQAASIPVPVLRVDGGATRNSALMQFQSDILGRPVLRSSKEELSGLGAAWLGGLTLGWWNSLDEIEHLPHPSECFEPSMPATERELLYSRWQLAVSRARLQGAPAWRRTSKRAAFLALSRQYRSRPCRLQTTSQRGQRANWRERRRQVYADANPGGSRARRRRRHHAEWQRDSPQLPARCHRSWHQYRSSGTFGNAQPRHHENVFAGREIVKIVTIIDRPGEDRRTASALTQLHLASRSTLRLRNSLSAPGRLLSWRAHLPTARVF